MATNAPTSRKARTSAVDAVTTPAVPAESEASKASRTAPLDLSALTVEDAPAPKVAAGAGRKAQDNTVAEGWLRESWAARAEGEKMGKGKAVVVPTAALGTLKSRLNIAARTLDLGVAIQTEDAGNDRTKVVFAAKVRKQRKQKDSEVAAAETPAQAA